MEEISKPIIKSYVYSGVDVFMVSTIYRRSSVMCNSPPWFYETLVWNYNEEKRERTDMIGQYNGYNPIENHLKICQCYYETGEGPIEEE